MDSILISCDDASSYPKNLLLSIVGSLNLDAYAKRLAAEEKNLFSPEQDAKVDFLEHRRNSKWFLLAQMMAKSDSSRVLGTNGAQCS